MAISTVSEFIAMLGGTRATAEWAGTTDAAVSMWLKRGCRPGGYHTRAIYEIKSRGGRPGGALFDLTDEQARVVFCARERRESQQRAGKSSGRPSPGRL